MKIYRYIGMYQGANYLWLFNYAKFKVPSLMRNEDQNYKWQQQTAGIQKKLSLDNDFRTWVSLENTQQHVFQCQQPYLRLFQSYFSFTFLLYLYQTFLVFLNYKYMVCMWLNTLLDIRLYGDVQSTNNFNLNYKSALMATWMEFFNLIIVEYIFK